ncbi:MAG: Wzz/FepE/Etk N-terminal domain-containing protein [Chthoniobacterales bacterium]
MPEIAQPPPSALSFSGVLRALFKHKRMVLLLTALGLLGAVAVYFFYPPEYVSQAKLLVRYVIERSGVDPSIDTTVRNSQSSDSVIASEVEILDSWDLAVQTAEAVGPPKLLPRARNPTASQAAVQISKGLTVNLEPGNNILFVSYKNRDPALAPVVLNELITRYFIKHLEVHRSAGAFDFVTQQTDQVRAQLNQTEDALRPLREKAGIISLASGTAALDAELAKTQDELQDAEAQLAEQKARVQEIGTDSGKQATASSPAPASTAAARVKESKAAEKATPAPEKKAASAQPASTPPSKPQATNSDILQYQALLGQLQQLHQTEGVLRSKYTDANAIVQANQRQIKELEKQRRDMEATYPSLPDTVRSLGGGGGGGGNAGLDPALEKARLAGFEARVTALKQRLHNVREKIDQLSDLRPQIAELERKEELEEANYKYFQATLEKARIDEALDPSKMPNISAVQKASPPVLETKSRDKLAGGLAVGGLAVGAAIALLLELILNRTVKVSSELENQLGIPLLLSIPYRNGGGSALPAPKDDSPPALAPGPNGLQIAPWDTSHFVRPYAEAIRDRLNLYFERHQMTHKPKLIGVTGLTGGAGTSTIAAGIAAALSEVHDGKVLLVDVKLGPGEVHPFFKGRPALSLPAVLQSNGGAESASENLYLATVGSSTAGLAQLGLKKFFEMMPNLKASDFDYIIFDMPPLTQTSPTLGMSGFMDKMLMVVAADETSRDLVKRSYRHLVVERKNVSVIFNKARSYTPRWLEGADATEEG